MTRSPKCPVIKCENVMKEYVKMFIKCEKHKAQKKKECNNNNIRNQRIGGRQQQPSVNQMIRRYMRLHGVRGGNRVGRGRFSPSSVVLTNNVDLLHQKPTFSVHISAFKSFFDSFIQGFKSVQGKPVRIIKDGKMYDLKENFNAYITCDKLNEGVDGKFLEDLKSTVKNMENNDVVHSLKNLFHSMKEVTLAMGSRCSGIDHMLDYIFEYLIKSKDSIRLTIDFDKIKKKAFKMLEMHVFDIAGKTIGKIFGQLKYFSSKF